MMHEKLSTGFRRWFGPSSLECRSKVAVHNSWTKGANHRRTILLSRKNYVPTLHAHWHIISMPQRRVTRRHHRSADILVRHAATSPQYLTSVGTRSIRVPLFPLLFQFGLKQSE